jgi:hypothetical protein
MKYRKLDADGDYVFGTGNDFHKDSPETVAQAVRTRLLLYQGDWFLQPDAGVPWRSDVLGALPEGAYEDVIRDAILETEGVTAIVDFSVTLDPDTRRLRINATIDTEYGRAEVAL